MFVPKIESVLDSISLKFVSAPVQKMLIDGQFVEAVSGKTMETLDPASRLKITEFPRAGLQEVDLAVGNIIGSNIFNLLLVLGATALLRDITLVDSKIILDYGVMIMVTVFLGILCVLTPKYQLSRYKGLFLLTMYLIYITYSVSLI